MDSSLPLQSLLERLKGATGPDREIDALLWAHFEGPEVQVLGWSAKSKPWTDYGVGPGEVVNPHSHVDGLVFRRNGQAQCFSSNYPAFTRSIDAALALVERALPGWDIVLLRLTGDPWEANIEPPNCPGEDRWRYLDHRGANPALALCVALLQALIASKSPSEPSA